MASPKTSIPPLTTVFTPPAGCQDRYALYVATPSPIGGVWTNAPSSGWVDPSYTKCIPSQATSSFPIFSPGVCPSQMEIVRSSSTIENGKTVWEGQCCQSGFTTMKIDPRFYCTSSPAAPMPFLLDPNISTTDIWTTASVTYIMHNQITVRWEEADLKVLPKEVASQYASMMGVAVPTETTPAEDSSSTSRSQVPTVKGTTTSLPVSTGDSATSPAAGLTPSPTGKLPDSTPMPTGDLSSEIPSSGLSGSSSQETGSSASSSSASNIRLIKWLGWATLLAFLLSSS